MKLLAAAIALLALSAAATAQEYTKGQMHVSQPWARVIMADRPAAGYMKVHNSGDVSDRIVSASSSMAERVRLHGNRIEDGVMKMRPVDTIEVPANGRVELKSGGLHLMIFGLASDVKAGDRIPVTVTFERAGPLEVDFAVGMPDDGRDEENGHSGHSE